MIIDLNLKDKNVLIIGAGREGTKKIKFLLRYDCRITVISDKIDKNLYELEKENNVKIIERKIEDLGFLDEFNNIFIIFTITNDIRLNENIIKMANKKGILAYSIDNPSLSDFSFMSVVNFNEFIRIAISTGGKSPIMTKIITKKIEKSLKNIIGNNDIENIKIQEFAREQARKYLQDPMKRKEFLYGLINDQEIQELISKKNIDMVKERIINTLGKWEDIKGG